jgi:hypothetical protein
VRKYSRRITRLFYNLSNRGAVRWITLSGSKLNGREVGARCKMSLDGAPACGGFASAPPRSPGHRPSL